MFPRANRLITPWPVPEMVLIGGRFRRARLLYGLSQRRLAELAGVSQSAISRFERGLVTGMAVERLVAIAYALGPEFPFGCCPHEHRCDYPRDPTTPLSLDELLR